MEPRISLVTLGVTDLQRAVHFYQHGLGWIPSGVGNDTAAFFQTGGIVLALYLRDLLAADMGSPSEGSGFRGFALAHNVHEREQVERVLDQAVAAGATLLKPATDVFWGGRSGYFADPEGFVWEVAWNPGFPLDPDGAIQLPL